MIKRFKELFTGSKEITIVDHKGPDGEHLINVCLRKSGITTELKGLDDTEVSALLMAVHNKHDRTGDVTGELDIIEAIRVLDDIPYVEAGLSQEQLEFKIEGEEAANSPYTAVDADYI